MVRRSSSLQNSFPATISVFDGTVQVEHASTPQAGGFKIDVRAGESLTGDPSDSSQYSVSQNLEQDSWDEWNRSRDQAAADAALNRTPARDAFTGDQGYGWSDLDANGSQQRRGRGGRAPSYK